MTTEKKAPRRTRNRQPLASGPEARAIAERAKLQVVGHDDSGLPAHARRAAKTPPQMDETGTFVAPAERRRRAIKEPVQQAPVSVGSRRCTGSRTFGIAEHQAPVADFPIQPSRKDGLGTMCKTHWREYTNALRKAALERKALDQVSDRPDVASGQLDGLEAQREAIAAEAAKGRAKRAAARQAPVVDPALVAARALVDEVDRMPAPLAAKRTGDDDVQAALALVARAGGMHREDPAEA